MNKNKNGEVNYHSTLESGYDFFIKDRWKYKYHFKIASFPVPAGMASEAVEVKKDGTSCYRFEILSDIDDDIEEAEKRLQAVIIKNINKKHLARSNGRPEIEINRIVEGRIEYNDADSRSAFDRIFVIDGKEITIEAFVSMLEPYEGWGIKFQIVNLITDYRRTIRP